MLLHAAWQETVSWLAISMEHAEIGAILHPHSTPDHKQGHPAVCLNVSAFVTSLVFVLTADGAGGAATTAVEVWTAKHTQKKNYDHLKGPERKAAMEDDKRVLPHKEIERLLRMNRMAAVRPRDGMRVEAAGWGSLAGCVGQVVSFIQQLSLVTVYNEGGDNPDLVQISLNWL